MGRELEQFANDCAKLCPAIEPDIVKAAIKAGARIQKQACIEAFRHFVEDYCAEAGFKEISLNAEHCIKVFKEFSNI